MRAIHARASIRSVPAAALRRWAAAAALAAIAVAAGCQPAATSGPSPAVHEERSIELDGFTRTYLLVRPAPPTDQPRPLLLVYHGAGSSARDIVTGTALASQARDAGMLVAALDAVPASGSRWANNPVDLQTVDDLTFTRAVVDAVSAEHPVDRDRIFAVGYSRGGEFVYQLACRAAELVRGIASVSATLLRTNLQWCEQTAADPGAVSVTMVLGSEDPIIPWEGGPTRLSAPETLAHWAARNGCPAAAAEQPVPARTPWQVTRTAFAPCTHGDVQLFRVEPMVHAWPRIAFDVERMIVGTFLEAAGSAPPR